MSLDWRITERGGFYFVEHYAGTEWEMVFNGTTSLEKAKIFLEDAKRRHEESQRVNVVHFE